MKEVWKDIPGFEGRYQISNLGNIKSINWRNTNKERLMVPQDNGHGYKWIGLRDGSPIKKQFYIHRLVAQAFIPNPNNLPQVNHKDGNTKNNCVDNLEWCTANYNLSYGDRHEKEIKTQQLTHPNCKEVLQYSLDGVLIKKHHSQSSAGRELGIHSSGISSCCKGKLIQSGGFKWRYAE